LLEKEKCIVEMKTGNNLLEKRVVEMKNGNKRKKMIKRKEPND
jgi:hypothetical protein